MKKTYWIFRCYMQVNPNPLAYASIKDIPPPEDWEIKESFALHFIKPYRTRRAAKRDIKNALLTQPWQKFIILQG